MRVGSLFSGIGGLDLGLERAGMTVAWQVEWDQYCQQVLAKHWLNVPRFGDVKDCGAHNLKPVDLICGGFPCQPVSCAGKRRGDKDDRWLWPEFARLVCELRPRWVLAENVPGLLSADAGRLFGGILRDLAGLGYDAEWELLPACAFGAPHVRYRMFVIARACSNTNSGGRTWPQNETVRTISRSTSLCGQVAHADRPRLAKRQGVFRDDGEKLPTIERSGWWAVEPDVGRVADGVPARVDRLKGLGNAVVPQVAEWIGRRIMEVEHAE